MPNARQRLETGTEPLADLRAALLAVADEAGIDLEDDARIEIESRLEPGADQRGLDEKTGRDQQNHRQRQLENDRKIATGEPPAPERPRGRLDTVLEVGDEVGSRRP